MVRAFRPQARLYHFRSHDGLEVDGIVRSSQHVLPFEVKASRSVAIRDARSLARYLELDPQARVGLVFYMGAEVFRLTGKILALPVTALTA